MWETVTPLVDEPAQRSYWQTSAPKVGDRVRVRLSGECRVPVVIGQLGGFGLTQPEVGHYDIEQAAVGTVRQCPNPVAFGYCNYCERDRHPFVVFFDSPLRGQKVRLEACHYAASELEPLEPAGS